jgi:hypothetical protein
MNDVINKVVNTVIQVVVAVLLTKVQEAKQLEELEKEDFIKTQVQLVIEQALAQIPENSNFLKNIIKHFILLQAESIEKLCEQSVNQLLNELKPKN